MNSVPIAISWTKRAEKYVCFDCHVNLMVSFGGCVKILINLLKNNVASHLRSVEMSDLGLLAEYKFDMKLRKFITIYL